MLRHIRDEDIDEILSTGEVIERYEDDTPYPSRLLCKIIKGRPLHIVTAYDAGKERHIIITVYEPEPELWSKNFMKRRSS